jgi:hypothetical protein
VYTHGSGIRARRKRWFLKVAGSLMGHHLQGEVHGGMTLVFACRGPPGCSEQRYVTAVWLPCGRGFPGGFLRLAVLRRPEPALFCVIERLCVHAPRWPSLFRWRSIVGACPHAPSAGCSDRTVARADANSLAGCKARRWRRSPPTCEPSCS